MKKYTAISLSILLALSLAGTALAATNPFIDVPVNHWAYDAVNKLAHAGVITGTDGNHYQGDRMITRYEMAQLVAKAMAQGDSAAAEEQLLIKKLSVEFADELANLGVRIARLEQQTDKVQVTGNARLRYRNTHTDNWVGGTDDFKLRSQIFFTGQVNSDWSYLGMLEDTEDLRSSGYNGNVKLNRAYISGPLLGAQLTLGRIDYAPVNGVFADSYFDGLRLEFGNILKTIIRIGKEDDDGKFDGPESVDYYGAELRYNPSPAYNFAIAYHHLDDSNGAPLDQAWEMGIMIKTAKNLNLVGNYVDTNAKTDGKAYTAGLAYKGASTAQAGSFGITANYLHFEPNSVWDSTNDIIDVAGKGAKGYEVGFSYTPAKNMVLKTNYVDARPLVNNAGEKSKFSKV